ncbi:DUF3558 family protein [Nocardia sp. NPDC058499]|uniref:DUF3558 family protein n=1 Tax=Nocardia sp. NPDC058499 TaxID=3346530 RepID=UPI003658D74B
MAGMLVLGLAASACSASTAPQEPAAATESAPTSLPYPEFLSEAQKATLPHRAAMRAMDPCGLLDTDALASIGHATYIGANNAYGECSSRFSPPAGPLQIREISVAFTTSTGTYGTPVAGTPIRISATPDFCTAYIMFDETRHIGLAYTVSSPGNLMDSGRGPREDLCPTAQAVATAAIPLTKTPVDQLPQRGDAPPFTEQPEFPAHAQVNHPLATLDPCAVLSTVAAGAPILRFYPDSFGWQCNFVIDPDNHANAHHVWYTYGVVSAALEPGAYRKEESRITVGGHPAVQTRGKQYRNPSFCQIVIAADPDAQPTDADGEVSLGHMIHVAVDESGCDAALEMAEAIVDLYNTHCEANRDQYPAMSRCRA